MLSLATSPAAHAGIGDALGQIGDGLAKTRERVSAGFSKTFAGLSDGLGTALSRLGQQHLNPTEGTVAIADAIEHQGVARPLLIIEPALASPEKAPLVVLLHYSGGNAEVMANVARAGRLAAEHGAWVVLPEAINGHWGDDPSTSASSGDVEFLAKLIAHMSATYPIDARRVFMAGMSNGGFMTVRFACEKAGLVAAVAVDAASMRNSQNAACKPSRPVPIVSIVGTRDAFVAYEHPLGMLSAEENYARWSAINGCNAASRTDTTLPSKVSDRTTIKLRENYDCSGGSAVNMYTVVNGGHAWPGSQTPIAVGHTSQNLDATEAIWDFFAQF
ncbi:alpha/beta hydrolase family esterase [Hydrocarboniphaga sp.]|uniref:alpha/beta hydrolase family esterase n=1 Tax=Hydrocarboniphaga sp. TaxID=2033016 RepID=UPI003D1185A2